MDTFFPAAQEDRQMQEEDRPAYTADGDLAVDQMVCHASSLSKVGLWIAGQLVELVLQLL